MRRITGSGSQVITYKMNTPSQTGQNLGPRNASLNVGAFIAAANVEILIILGLHSVSEGVMGGY
jgi:hypothetical protein